MKSNNRPMLHERSVQSAESLSLSKKFKIEDLHNNDPSAISEIFNLYHKKLSQQVPTWAFYQATKIDAEGIVSETLLNILESGQAWENFDQFDKAILDQFDNLYRKSVSQAKQINIGRGKEINLDRPVNLDDESTISLHDVIADNNVYTPLDLMILSQETEQNTNTPDGADYPNEKDFLKQDLHQAALEVLSPYLLDIYISYYKANLSLQDIALRLNKDRILIKGALTRINARLDKKIKDPEWTPYIKPITDTSEEAQQKKNEVLEIARKRLNPTDFKIFSMHFSEGISMEDISSNLDIEKNDVFNSLCKMRSALEKRTIFKGHSAFKDQERIAREVLSPDEFSLYLSHYQENKPSYIIASQTNRLNQTVKNAISKIQRKLNKKIEYPEWTPYIKPITGKSEEAQQEKKDTLAEAKRRLRPRLFEIFSMHFSDGISMEDISRELNITENDVYYALCSAKRAFEEKRERKQKEQKPLKKHYFKDDHVYQAAQEVLSPDSFDIYLLFYMQGISVEHISTQLKESEFSIYNKLHDIRKQLYRKIKSPEWNPYIKPITDTSEEAQKKKKEILANARHELNAEYFQVFFMHFSEGISIEEIASTLEFDKANVFKKLCVIKQILDRKGDEKLEAKKNRLLLKENISQAAQAVLSPNNLEIYNLYYLKNKSVAEIAQQTNKNDQSVYGSMIEIRRQLARKIKDSEWTPLPRLITGKSKDAQNEKKETLEIAQQVLDSNRMRIFFMYFSKGLTIRDIAQKLKLEEDDVFKNLYITKHIIDEKKTNPLWAPHTRRLDDLCLNLKKSPKKIIRLAGTIFNEECSEIFKMYYLDNLPLERIGDVINRKIKGTRDAIKYIEGKLDRKTKNPQWSGTAQRRRTKSQKDHIDRLICHDYGEGLPIKEILDKYNIKQTSMYNALKSSQENLMDKRQAALQKNSILARTKEETTATENEIVEPKANKEEDSDENKSTFYMDELVSHLQLQSGNLKDLSNNKIKEKIQQAKDVLNPDYSVIFTLHFEKDMPSKAISEQLGKKDKYIRSSIHHIKAYIHKKIEHPYWQPQHAPRTKEQIMQDAVLFQNDYCKGLSIPEIARKNKTTAQRVTASLKNSDNIEELENKRNEFIANRKKAICKAYANNLTIKNIEIQFNIGQKGLATIIRESGNEKYLNRKREFESFEFPRRIVAAISSKGDTRTRDSSGRYATENQTRLSVMTQFLSENAINWSQQQIKSNLENISKSLNSKLSFDERSQLFTKLGTHVGEYVPKQKDTVYRLINHAHQKNGLTQVYLGMVETAQFLSQKHRVSPKLNRMVMNEFKKQADEITQTFGYDQVKPEVWETLKAHIAK